MAFLAVLGGIFGIALLIAVASIWRGYVFSVLWGWFIVPTFALPALSIPLAIGIAMVVSFLTYQFHHNKDDRKTGDKVAAAVGTIILYPLLTLGIGWVVLQFI